MSVILKIGEGKMTFEQIEYFLSCASCLNFSLAAKYHYVSVSTLSRNITALENELGVRLFIRGYHGHTLTREGKRFFNFAEDAMASFSYFWQSIGRTGPAGTGEDSLFRIACYPFDSMFEKIVEMVSVFPSDWLGKSYHVFFVKSGTMPDAVLSGRMHIGVDSAVYLEKFGSVFSTHRFFRSPFRLVMSKNHPLAGRSGIKPEELLIQYHDYSRFLPSDIYRSSYSDCVLRTVKDINALGETTICNLPYILPRLNTMDLREKMLVLPEELNLPALYDMASVALDSANIFTDYVLFWKRENTDLAVTRFLEMLDYPGK